MEQILTFNEIKYLLDISIQFTLQNFIFLLALLTSLLNVINYMIYVLFFYSQINLIYRLLFVLSFILWVLPNISMSFWWILVLLIFFSKFLSNYDTFVNWTADILLIYDIFILGRKRLRYYDLRGRRIR